VRRRGPLLFPLALLALLLPAAAGAGTGGAPACGPGPCVPVLDQFDVFSDRAIRTFAFELPEARWEALRRSAPEERWTAARLEIEGVRFGVVGVRFKGAAGTLAACFRDGVQICPKLPLKVRFSRFDAGRRFFGLDRLNFHAMQRDRSLVRERLAYRVFERAGVAAPRTAWAWLRVNGEDLGLFAIVEAIDGRFADARFHFDGGLLYKEAWPATTDPAYYQARLRTQRGQEHDHAEMIGFARELAEAGPDELPALLERWTDVDHLLRYMAADRLIGNWDGITAWYCDQGPCTNHNFYWYVERERRRLWLVPWDLDDAMRLFDPLHLSRDWLDPGGACRERPLAWGKRPILHPGCDRLLGALAALARERFGPVMAEVLERAFDPRELRAQVLAWRELLAPFVARDPNGPGPAVFEAELEALLAALPRLRARGEAIARGEPVAPFGLELGARNDFEAASEVSVWRSIRTAANPRSRVAHGLGLSRALAGRADLRFDFELRDESREPRDRFLQWASLRIPFARGSADLREVGRLRLRLRADAPRTVRIDVESRSYPSDDPALRWGWDVAVSPRARIATLELADLALPAWSTAEPVPVERVLSRASALSFHPQPVGRLASGFFPRGRSDPGAFQIDDVELLAPAGGAPERSSRPDLGAGPTR
jgi:hypothetical protein